MIVRKKSKGKVTPELNWEEQRICTDIGKYELVVEKKKRDWEYKQTMESWEWVVVYHGSVVASGSINDMEEAEKSDCVKCDDDD